MTDIVNNATIMVTADASGVEAGLRPAIDAAQNAERAIAGIGGGSQSSARAQQSLIRAIERTTIQMQAGSRAGSLYFEILGRRRGIDPNVLRPYLDELRRIEEAQRDAGTSAEDAGAAIRASLGSALAGLSVAGFLQQVVSAQREFDKLNASLKTAVGSTDAAAEAFGALERFASTTPYSMQQAVEGFVKLRNMGLDPSERALRSYGNTAAAMGKDLDQMIEAVADAATGEFERLKEFGIKASQENGKVSLTFKGTTTTIVNSATEIEKYLMRLGEVDFASAMAERASTLDGAVSNFGDTWTATMRTISQGGIGQAAQEGLTGFSAALEDLQHMLDAVSEAANRQQGALSVASGIHITLTTIFEALTVTGLNVAYVFKQIGMGIGGAAAQATALAQGNWEQVKEIRRLMAADMARDRAEVDAQSAAILGAAEKARKAAAAAPAKQGATDVLAQYRIQREAERESEAATKQREAQYRREAAALAELAGLSASFSDDWKMLSTLYGKGAISLDQLTKAQADLLAKQPAMKAAAEQEAAALKSLAEFQDGYSKGLEATSGVYAKRVQDAQDEATRNEELARTYGMTKSAVEQLELARLEGQLAQRSTLGLTLTEIETLEKLIDAKKRNAGAVSQMAGVDAAKKAAEELTDFLDPARAQSFGDALREAFGGAGDSISKLTASLMGFSQRQAEIEKNRGNAALLYLEGKKTEVEYLADVEALSKRSTQNQLAGYGAMTGAAAGFFNEQSRGYKALQTASQVFHAAELAMTLAELVPKGISAVLGQGQGDPYTAFGRMAAMAAIVAGLGVAIGGVSGGGVPLSQQRQEKQGTGTVLGSDAKSESIARSLDAIEGATLQGLGISNGMLTSLRNIESNIESFASLLVQTTGVTGDFGSDMNKKAFDSKAIGLGGAAGGALLGAMGGAYVGMGTSYIGAMLGGPVGMALGAALGAIIGKTFIGKALGSVFGGKQTVEDTGLTIGATDFASIFGGGLNAMQYADIKKDGGWFRSDKYSTKTEGLGEEGNRQIASVLMSLYDTVLQAGSMLDIGADGFAAQLNSFVVDIGKVSLKGLSDDEIQKELEAVFSKVGDDLAKFGVGGLEQFQKVGEGYLETLTRVATNYQAVAVVTDSLGMTFGSLGLASVGARERLIDLVGGLDEFTSSADQFLADFYTDQERANSLRARITPTLDQFGIKTGAEDSLQQFRSVVTGLDLTTEAGARAYATLIQIAPAFKQIADVDAKIFEERADLQKELDQLTLSETQLLAQQRAALDESNRALFDQVQAVKAQASAAQAAKNAAASLLGGVDAAFSVLQRVVSRQKTALQEEINFRTKSVQQIESLSQSLRSTLDGMTVQGREAEDRQAAQAQIEAALAIAKASGTLPKAEDLKNALSVVGRSSADQYATQQDYLRDFYATRMGIEDLAGLTDEALSVEERSLKQLEDQVKQYDLMLEKHQEEIDVLKGISTIGLSIEQAILTLRGAMQAASANPVVSAGSAISDAYKTHLGRAPDAAGLDYWKDVAAGGTPVSEIVDGIANSTEANLNKLYQEVLGRAPDAAGLDFFVKAYGGTMDATEIADFIKSAKGSEEYKLRGFAVGTNQVPYDMPAYIHKDERIIPAADNRELMRRLASPEGNNEALVAELRLLRQQVESLRNAALRTADSSERTANSTEQFADQFENVTDGGNAMRTEELE